MKIAILGTGNMGAGFAHLFAAHHEVSIGSRDPAKAAALAGSIGQHVVGGGIAAATKLADVIVLALPFPAIAEVLKDAGDLQGKVLIDITNPVTPDFQDLAFGHTTSAAEKIQELVPQAIVIKAFNTIFAQLLPETARQGKNVQVFLAGDAEKAKETVATLARSAGFDPVDCGALKHARLLEPIGMMNIQFGFFLGKGPSVAPAWINL